VKAYIAARYGRRDEAREVASQLQSLRYDITSSWLWQVEDEMLYDEGPEAASRFAQKDVEEIRGADAVVYLSEKEDNVWGRGGRHVEFGIAVALEKHIFVIGPMENLFHYLPGITHCNHLDDFIEYLKEE
jgi:nucleoside 2-deoxyribosyltransferase